MLRNKNSAAPVDREENSPYPGLAGFFILSELRTLLKEFEDNLARDVAMSPTLKVNKTWLRVVWALLDTQQIFSRLLARIQKCCNAYSWIHHV